MTESILALPFALDLAAVLLIVLVSFCIGFVTHRITHGHGQPASRAASIDLLIYTLFLLIAFLMGVFLTYAFFLVSP